MKIRFDSPKESRPSEESGLQVRYAPGRRLAFRLRWYLILLLVASPLLWLGGRWLWSTLGVEAPARLVLPTLQLRAFDSAQVREVLVEPGQEVVAGAPLLRLDNPAWRERLTLLEASAPTWVEPGEPTAGERRALEEHLAIAEQRLVELRRLFARAAATRGELLQAESERAARRQALWQFEQRQVRSEPPGEAERRLEGQWLKQRLADLEVRAPEAGRVVELQVAAGEAVAAGLPLLTLERQQEVQVWVYLATRHAAYAQPGRELSLRLPDGTRLDARVTGMVRDTALLPAELQPPFGASERPLLVRVEPVEPWPQTWRIERLDLQARFANDWSRSFWH